MKRIVATTLLALVLVVAVFLFLGRSEKRNQDSPEESTQPPTPQQFAKIEKNKIPERNLDLAMIGKLINGSDWKEVEPFLKETTLKREDWEAYMAKHGRDTETLAAAARHLRDPELFAELAENHGQAPLVAAAILEFLIQKPDQSEILGGREKWVQHLKENDPENGIAALYAARFAFEEGDPVTAYLELQEVESAFFADFYTAPQIDQLKKVYADAGWGNDDAFILSQLGTAVPSLNEMTKMSQDIAAAMDEALEAGNQALAEDLWEGGIAAAGLIREVEEAEVIGAAVGRTMEAILFDRLDAFDLAPGEETLIIEWMAESEARFEIIRGFGGGRGFSESDWRTYWRIVEAEGEIAAMRWAVEK